MRTGSSDILSQGHSGRNRLDARLEESPEVTELPIDLEGLESRTLLATIPAASIVPGTSPVKPVDAARQRSQRQREQSLGRG